MKNVEQLLKTKSQHQTVYTIGPDDSVLDALKLLAEKNVGALPVVENDQVVGIISERDYARKLVLKGRSSAATPVREIMSAPVITVEPKRNLDYCMQRMTDLHLRHLPVVDNGKLLGLLSIGDLVKETIAEQANLINQLEQYIRGE
ncbi:TPA: CBS domain-containing protein [Pseudomonas putida]